MTETDDVLDGIWDFFGVPSLAGAASAAFEQAHDRNGRADHKVWWTRSIRSESIGSGARVPADHVVGPVRDNMNQMLVALGYPTVGDDWGNGASAPASEPASEPDGLASEAARDAELVELRVVEGHNVVGRGVVDLATASWVQAYAGNAGSRLPQRTSRVVAAERVTLAEICAGTQNVGTALRARTVRYYGPPIRGYDDELEIFERLLGFLITAVGLQGAPA